MLARVGGHRVARGPTGHGGRPLQETTGETGIESRGRPRDGGRRGIPGGGYRRGARDWGHPVESMSEGRGGIRVWGRRKSPPGRTSTRGSPGRGTSVDPGTRGRAGEPAGRDGTAVPWR